MSAILDPVLNYFPDNINHIHLMGICGTAMGALAGMLKSKGYRVTGSDQHVYPPMSDFLAALDIAVLSGYSPENLEPPPDLVVVGNVITAKNPEAAALEELKIPYVSLPQALAEKFIGSRKSLVVCGTHGKTTTSSLLATMLSGAGFDAGFMIGGLVQAFGRNFHIGVSDYFVVEGDEYDTAFFDKGPKFLHYRPNIVILTSIEFDHADIYADLEAVKESFRRLVAVMPDDGCIVACFDDPVVREIMAEAKCRVLSYGQDKNYAWSLTDVVVGQDQTNFLVSRQGRIYGKFSSVMPGYHNCLNSLAVIAVFELLGVPSGTTARELSRFQGVRRRQEVRGKTKGITVIDDFAHHPTAVRETLAALAAAYKGHRLVAVFEPRTNSSRRRIFQLDYVTVFDQANEVVIREPDKIPGLAVEEMFSAATLVADLRARGVAASSFGGTGEIIDYLLQTLSPEDVVVIMSNGGFDNIHVRLLAGLDSGP